MLSRPIQPELRDHFTSKFETIDAAARLAVVTRSAGEFAVKHHGIDRTSSTIHELTQEASDPFSYNCSRFTIKPGKNNRYYIKATPTRYTQNEQYEMRLKAQHRLNIRPPITIRPLLIARTPSFEEATRFVETALDTHGGIITFGAAERNFAPTDGRL